MQRLPYVLAAVLCLTAGGASADNQGKALALFEKSDKAYKAGKFEDAVKLLNDAYKLHPEPILLYNLGRAQEGMGDIPGAIASYERYLKDAKRIQDRGAIERRVATLKALEEQKDTEAQRLAEEEARRKQAEADKAVAEAERAEAERLRAQQQARENARSPLETYGPWLTIGSGAVAVATGLWFGARASTTHDDAIAAPIQRDALALQESAERSATIANVLFVAGGITLAGGIVWKLWQWKTSDDGGTAQVIVAPNTVSFGGTW